VSNLGYAVKLELNASGSEFVPDRDNSLGGRSAKLRATAARFRVLAENSFDPNIIAAVQAFAKDLESEAALIEARIGA
jgi:hypothetical protein